MSARTAASMTLDERIASASRARLALFLVPLAVALATPFVPMALLPLVALVGVPVGVYAALAQRMRVESSRPPAIDSMYRFQTPDEPSLIRHIYIGHAMDFTTYRAGLSNIQAIKGQITTNDRVEYNRQVIDRMRPFFLSDDIATRHMFIGGSTGVGKSEMYKAMAYSQIRRGGGLIMFDAKGDEAMFTELYTIARSSNREHDCMYLNLDRPDLSHSYNPLIHGSVRQLVSTAMKLEGGGSSGDNEFWSRLNRNTLIAAIICLRCQPGEPRFNFADLAALVSQPRLFIDYYASMPTHMQEEREFVFQYLIGWISPDKDGVQQLNYNRFRDLLTGLRSLLMDFCHSEYRALINDYNPDIELKSCILESKIVMISLPALSDKQGVEVFGRLFLADLSRAVGQLYADRTKAMLPFLVFLDEYGSFADETHEELFMAARGAGISMICSVQGRGFLDKIGKEFTANILTNAWNHVYLDVRDPDTRETAIKLAGTVINQFRQKNMGSSFGSNYRNWESGLLRTEAHGQTMSDGYREMREDLLNPEDFAMDPGDAILIGKHGTYRLRLPRVRFESDVPSLDAITLPRYERAAKPGLNLATKLLDAEHNTLLQAARIG